MPQLAQFFADTLPADGYYCLCTLPKGAHLWSESTEELARSAAQHLHRQGLYFGTAAYATPANRKQTNVLALKALRLDIDAGPEKYAKHGDKVYCTQQDALGAFVAFSRALKLPPTYVVSSGAGLHIYYCLQDAVAPDLWGRLAAQLQASCEAHGLKADHHVTCDSARVLRVPGAPHTSGAIVSILQRLDKFYTPAELTARLAPVAPPVEEMPAPARTFDVAVNTELGIEAPYDGPPRFAQEVALHCKALREIADAGGDVPEPQWRAMLGLVKFCAEGRDIAHQWSRGHTSYSELETDRKLQLWAAGPTTCNEFAKHTEKCRKCAHHGALKSPIVLGVKAVVATTPEAPPEPEEAPPVTAGGNPWDTMLPQGYTVERTKTGDYQMVSRYTEEVSDPETGETAARVVVVPFTNSVFWFGQWAGADNSDDTAQVVLYLWQAGIVRRYVLDQTCLASPSKLLDALSAKAIHTTTHRKAVNTMHNYAKQQLRHIHSDHQGVKINDRLGLRTLPDGALVCAHGKHIIYPDGSIREALMGGAVRHFASAFAIPLPDDRPYFSPEIWPTYIEPRAHQYVRFLDKHFSRVGLERFQLAIMLSIASPLMAFVTGEYTGGANLPINSSLTVSLYSRASARGKTAVARMAMLAYGRPSELVGDSSRQGATNNARIGTLSLHGTMPSVMDEVTNLGAAEVADIVSAVANGTGKRTMTQVRSLRRESSWSLINLVTTNSSQRAMVSNSRENSAPVLYRLLEIDVDNMPEFSIDQRIAFQADASAVARDCAGALGAVLHREICRMGDLEVTRIVLKCVAHADEYLKANQTDRFQGRGLGALLAAHLILENAGYKIFDRANLKLTFLKAYNHNKDYVDSETTSETGLSLLSRALSDLTPQTLITKTFTSHGGDCVIMNDRMPLTVIARHVICDGITLVSSIALRKWCVDNNVSAHQIITEADKSGVLVRMDGGRPSIARHLMTGIRTDMKLRTNVYTFRTNVLNALMGISNEARVVEGGEEDTRPAQTTRPPYEGAGHPPLSVASG